MSEHMLRCPEGSTNTTWKALWNSAREGCEGEKEHKMNGFPHFFVLSKTKPAKVDSQLKSQGPWQD